MLIMPVQTRSIARNHWLILVASLTLCASASPALAQGRGHGGSKELPPGQAKKMVTPAQAVVVSRDVLVMHGFEVVRVETIKTGQVIYYRRGNNGRGRGLGPVEKMVVRPSGSTVIVESAPRNVLLDIRVRLGL
jgi:hypothetical protein